MILKIGSRRCRLARAQAETAGKALAAHYPGLEIQTVEIVTFGDRVWDRPMGSIGGNEIFVDALERELNEYGIDIAVHSADELPSEMGEGLEIAGVLPRAESGEVLVTRSTAEFSRKNRFLVGTESLRRRRNLSKFYPKAEFTDISGNAETRLLKLADRQCDAIILRAEEAALLADQLDGFRVREFSCSEFIPAPCQGMIAMECKKDSIVSQMISGIKDERTWLSFNAEHEFLKAFDTDCASAEGAFTEINDGIMNLTVSDGSKSITGTCDPENGAEKMRELIASLK